MSDNSLFWISVRCLISMAGCIIIIYPVYKYLIPLKLKNVAHFDIYKFSCQTYNNILDDSFTLSGNINISSLPSGEYNVYLVLADDFTNTAIRGIRFANYYMYDEMLQANKITTVTIN